MADADIDDMWERADRANRAAASARQAYIENGDSVIESHGSVSGVKDDDGNFVTTATNKEGKTTVNKKPLRRDRSYTNQMVNDMSQQMHQNMDPYVDFNLTIMDSVLLERLADRNIYPDFVAVEGRNPMAMYIVETYMLLKMLQVTMSFRCASIRRLICIIRHI